MARTPDDKKRGRSPYTMSDAHKDAIRVSNILAREKIEIKRGERRLDYDTGNERPSE